LVAVAIIILLRPSRRRGRTSHGRPASVVRARSRYPELTLPVVMRWGRPNFLYPACSTD
jgi:hypothetical protein